MDEDGERRQLGECDPKQEVKVLQKRVKKAYEEAVRNADVMECCASHCLRQFDRDERICMAVHRAALPPPQRESLLLEELRLFYRKDAVSFFKHIANEHTLPVFGGTLT